MELLKSYLRQSGGLFDDGATRYGTAHFRDFGNLEFEKYAVLRGGESAKRTWFMRVDFRSGETTARYLFFFGRASFRMRKRCRVTLHIAREEPPSSFYYERLEYIQATNVPDFAEVGYEIAHERFVVRPRNGRERISRVEEFGKRFFEGIVASHFAT